MLDERRPFPLWLWVYTSLIPWIGSAIWSIFFVKEATMLFLYGEEKGKKKITGRSSKISGVTSKGHSKKSSTTSLSITHASSDTSHSSNT